jgi:D-alanyl-lipoteichoic acid acyltransferase DltB (MBOAT superfamily)
VRCEETTVLCGVAAAWQRWHISLSNWLRDYLYRALRGNKRDVATRMYRNMFLTMLLGGLWHGANWTFVIWDAIHGAALVSNVSPKVAITNGRRRVVVHPFDRLL